MALKLFPPLIDSYLPAFVVTGASTDTCEIPFSMSSYNSSSIKIKQVHISIRDMKTNKVISTNKVIIKDLSNIIDNKSSVTISASELKSNKFTQDCYYKIQLRFSQSEYTEGSNLNSYLTENTSDFSEWSTVGIIKGIYEVSLSLSNLLSKNGVQYITTFDECIGKVIFNESSTSDSTEYLESYRIRIINSGKQIKNSNTLTKVLTDTTPLFDSGETLANLYNTNEINCEIKKTLTPLLLYNLIIDIKTNNGYTNAYFYNFKIKTNSIPSLLPSNIKSAKTYDELDNGIIKFIAEPNERRGYVKVTIEFNYNYSGSLCFRRTSNLSNWITMEDCYIIPYTFNKGTLDEKTGHKIFTFNDYSIESGIYYKYGVQQKDFEKNQRGIICFNQGEFADSEIALAPSTLLTEAALIRCDFEESFLTTEDYNLRITLNNSIGSFSKKVSEGMTETIGSKYGYFRRVGNSDYKTFDLQGTISYLMDEDNLNMINFNNSYENATDTLYLTDDYEYNFATDKSSLFRTYRDNHKAEDEYYVERFFREQVYDFLNDGKCKLYRSLTEGNILVRLMDISMSPKQELGRLVWDFSATAYEADDANTLSTLDEYDIIPSLLYTDYEVSSEVAVSTSGYEYGQIKISGFYADVISLLNTKLKNLSNEYGQYKKYLYFTWFKIDFDSDNVSSSIMIVDENGENTTIHDYGINYISPSYDLNVYGLYSFTNSSSLIDYIAYYQWITPTSSSEDSLYSYDTVVGQLSGNELICDSSLRDVISTHFEKQNTIDKDGESSIKHILQSIDKLYISGEENMAIEIKDISIIDSDSKDTDFFEHLIAYNQKLNFSDEDFLIKDFYYRGIKVSGVEEDITWIDRDNIPELDTSKTYGFYEYLIAKKSEEDEIDYYPEEEKLIINTKNPGDYINDHSKDDNDYDLKVSQIHGNTGLKYYNNKWNDIEISNIDNNNKLTDYYIKDTTNLYITYICEIEKDLLQ